MGGGTVDIKSEMESVDFGLGVGASYDITEQVLVNFRYSAGFTQILKEDVDIKNSVIQFGLGYRF